MTARRPQPFVRFCDDCGKRCFETKSDAKRVVRRLRDRGRMHAYRCGLYWHIGHLPARVVAGDKPRAEIKPKTRETNDH